MVMCNFPMHIYLRILLTNMILIELVYNKLWLLQYNQFISVVLLLLRLLWSSNCSLDDILWMLLPQGDHAALLSAFAEMGFKLRLDMPEQAMEITSVLFRTSSSAKESLVSMHYACVTSSTVFPSLSPDLVLFTCLLGF